MTASAGPELRDALREAQGLLGTAPATALARIAPILRDIPDQPAGLAIRGLALAALGRPAEAAEALHRASNRDPNSPVIWRTLGDQLVLLDRHAEADRAYAQQIRTSVQDPRLRQAAMALAANELPVAERLLKAHLRQYPTDVAAMRMLAELAGRIGRLADAEALLGRAIELAPGFAAARFNLATLLYRANRIAETLDQLGRLLADEPDNIASRNLAAAALGRVGDAGEALVHYEHILERQPQAAPIWMSYGHALKTVGRQGDSIAAYRRCIALAPGSGEAWWSLANLKTVRFDADDVAAMAATLDLPDLRAEDRMHLRFALAKALEDVGDIGAALGHYEEGNRLRLEAHPYDAGETSRRVDRAMALFTPAFFEVRAGQGCPAPDPIFVLGMPRAGSTLVEQILASHPLVEGTQELPDIQMMANRLAGPSEEGYPETLARLSAAELRALGEDYIEATRVHRRSDRPFFIDKMPNNWAHVGLIHLILPNARIVDARRHPIACCVSNFRQHFARGQNFAYSLADMGGYYADYVRLMEHVDRVLPGRVHRVFYEAMVDDTEAQVRALLDHLGLPFDPACLRFHETDRAVRTASSEQVRRPIYRDGLDQWRSFDRWIAPLSAALGTALTDYPHAAG